jgi:hypothetical protein
MLLWSTEDPDIPSGTILPVYIRSNIDQVWVVGIPEAYRQADTNIDKFEIPLPQLELVGNKKAAQKRAEDFSGYALTYAETLQDGLPIREEPDNGARRVYRLKVGQIIKVLDQVKGNPAISTTGDPLPGDWYQVLTEDGSTGYCFSYRLRFFEHAGGVLALIPVEEQAEPEDPALERVLAQSWFPESYGAMVSSGRIDTVELARLWRFFPGQDAGIARIYTAAVDQTFSYTRIRTDGERSWRFEGTSLHMSLQSDTTLLVQYPGEGGAMRSQFFVTLPADPEDIIVQETERRETLFQNIYTQGPVFTSTNYGTLSFSGDGRFTWTGNSLLSPHIIPATVLGNGAIDMRLFLDPALVSPYTGAFSLILDGVGGPGTVVSFMYTLDAQGFRIEHVPEEYVAGVTVTRRTASPTVIYFYRTNR